MINIIKWIIIELIILKKIYLKLILGTVWQSYRLSYRTWFVIPCLWHDISSIVIPNCVAWQCYTLSYRIWIGMTLPCIVIPNSISMTLLWIVIPNSCCMTLLNIVIPLHDLTCKSYVMLWIVIPKIAAWQCPAMSYRFLFQHDMSSHCHTDFICSMTLAHIVILIFVAWSYQLCHTSSRCCL